MKALLLVWILANEIEVVLCALLYLVMRKKFLEWVAEFVWNCDSTHNMGYANKLQSLSARLLFIFSFPAIVQIVVVNELFLGNELSWEEVEIEIEDEGEENDSNSNS